MKTRRLQNLAKYFIHGIAFSLLLFGLATYSGLFLGVLGIVPFYIGIIIGLGVLMILIGAGNSLIARVLWFPMKIAWKDWRDWRSYLGHGIYLFVLLVLVNLPLQFILSLALSPVVASPLVVLVVIYVILTLINGNLGKRIASNWQAEIPRVVSMSAGSSGSSSDSSSTVKVKKWISTQASENLSLEEKLRLEEARLAQLLEHRKRIDLLRPEALDLVIEEQKRTVEELRRSVSGSSEEAA